MPVPSHPTPAQVDAVRSALRGLFFAGWDDAYLSSPAFTDDLEAHATRRFEECRDVILPWIETYLPLAGRTVVDIGCGTGASTAAWATRDCRVIGYDIHAPSIAAARARLEALGDTSTRVAHVDPHDLIPRLRRELFAGADAFILYAVLEHQTVRERIDTLAACWQLLNPGGLLVVGDSPSRFSFFDFHTSSLPFYQWMPDELCLLYAHRSPRPDFARAIGKALAEGHATAPERLARMGRAVGYEEFELAIGDLSAIVVGDSFDDCMIDKPHRAVTLNDELVHAYVKAMDLHIPRGFLRPALEVILRKPIPNEPPRPPQAPAPVKGMLIAS